MSTTEKLQMLFEAAIMESEPTDPARVVPAPRNPNASQSFESDSPDLASDGDVFDPRREMMNRLSRIKDLLAD